NYFAVFHPEADGRAGIRTCGRIDAATHEAGQPHASAHLAQHCAKVIAGLGQAAGKRQIAHAVSVTGRSLAQLASHSRVEEKPPDETVANDVPSLTGYAFTVERAAGEAIGLEWVFPQAHVRGR